MKLITYYISICCLLLLLISCGNNENENRDKLIFRYNENAAINSLDPAFSRTRPSVWICNQLFSGLVQLDDSLNIKPDIAKSWQLSEDGKTYTFLLRNDVYFHKNKIFGSDSTRIVTATDFEYSFNRLTDAQIASPGRWVLQNVKKFKAVNDTVFTIELNKTFPAFLGLLTMKYASVVPHEAFIKGHDFRSSPIGTGPFQFKIWEENVKLVLRKNTLYYENDNDGKQLPYLEAVAVTFLPDKQSGFLQFAQGKLDFISGLDPSYKDEILSPDGSLQSKYKKNVKMVTGPYLNTEYIGFLMDGNNNAVKDKRIRQALNYGFDRNKMILFLRNGMGSPAIHGMIPAGLPGFYSIMGYNYDIQKAKKLIAEYKKETGDINPKIELTTSASYLDIAEYLQREWQKTGLNITVDVTPPSTLTQSISTGKVSIFKASWIADYPDAENYLSLFYSKNFAPEGPNYTHFKNNDFDRLYEQAFTETDDEKRYLLYKKMDEIIIEEAPVIPLFYDKAARFYRNNVYGLGINPLNLLVLKKVYKE